VKTVGQQPHWITDIRNGKEKGDNGCFYLHEDACEAAFQNRSLTFLLFYHASLKEQSLITELLFLLAKCAFSHRTFQNVRRWPQLIQVIQARQLKST
jgi:hypothetical protein